MKRDDLIDALEYIDEEFIRDADQTRNTEESTGDNGKITPLRRRKAFIRRWGMLAAGLAVFMIAAFAVSGVMKTRNGTGEVMQSAEAVKTEDTREDQTNAYHAEEQAEAYAPEEQAGMYDAEEQADTYAPAEKTDVNELEEQAGEYAPEEHDATESAAAPAIGSVTIRVISDAGEIRFVLNDTPAAESFAAQLPLTAETELYSDNEIVFHPGEPLAVENGIESGGTAGYIGYYAPWNNVVLYYGDFEKYPGLYILGEAVSGAENIKDIRGSITIELE